MRLDYQLFVPGVPKAQPRPRMTRSGHAYNPDSADAWKKEVEAAFMPFRRSREPIDEAVHLRVDFFLPVPKGMRLRKGQRVPHTKKPDADNLLKAVMDAMTRAGVWKDDALVFWTEASKWHDAAERTGALIIVETGFQGQGETYEKCGTEPDAGL